MEKRQHEVQAIPDWRLKLGVGLFALSLFLPVIGVPLVSLMNFSTSTIATTSAILLGLAEVLGLAAVAVMGKSGYAYIKGKFTILLKRYGPPQEVSRWRYTFGLFMFCLPVIFGWIGPYVFNLFPRVSLSSILWAVGGDVLFVASLFVLGGNFWDKLRALFIHDANICFK